MSDEEITFLQVLLFRDPDYAHELGPSLWAALREVESLYNHGLKRAQFERYFLAEEVPPGIEQGAGFDEEKGILAMASIDWWRSIGGRSAKLPLDKEALMRQVLKLLGSKPASARLVVVTDLEITPPVGWRYIIWDIVEGAGSVASVRPTDPHYWGLKEPARLQIIKQRVRAICCSIVGSWLGFKRCDNPRCVLHYFVESASQLDEMIYFGQEHKTDDLSGLGFPPRPGEPSEVQPVEKVYESWSEDDAAAFEELDFRGEAL